MDVYASGGIGAGAVVALGVLYRVYLAVNHHRVRSNCCGKELVVSVDVEQTTPHKPDLKIKIPKQEEQSPYQISEKNESKI